MAKQYHPFHLVNRSPWPFLLANSLFIVIIGTLIYLHYSYIILLIYGIFITSIILFFWFKDIITEGTFLGFHTLKVKQGFKIAMVLFIISEISFFSSFFWAFFHAALSPSINICCEWPPIGIETPNLFHLPLVNTIYLLFSAITLTICHNNMSLTQHIDSRCYTHHSVFVIPFGYDHTYCDKNKVPKTCLLKKKNLFEKKWDNFTEIDGIEGLRWMRWNSVFMKFKYNFFKNNSKLSKLVSWFLSTRIGYYFDCPYFFHNIMTGHTKNKIKILFKKKKNNFLNKNKRFDWLWIDHRNISKNDPKKVYSEDQYNENHRISIIGSKYLQPSIDNVADALLATIVFGFWFIFTQWIEFQSLSFNISDSVYGSSFFILTGFHGLHVFIGLILLIVSLYRLLQNHFSRGRYLGLEFSIWYWHFVDVVWLFLFICVYWWGS